MQTAAEIILKSGKTGVELALFILLPVMVVMMAVMRLLEDKGVLRRIALILSPLLILFGLPGLGIFAVLQILMVSFAAPVSTFRIMDQDGNISERKIAAALSAILTMSQANATFPLTVMGLNLPITILTSVLGGLLSGLLTYRFFGRGLMEGPSSHERDLAPTAAEERLGVVQTLLKGGEEGLQIVLKAIPVLVLAVLLVNILKAVSAVSLLESLLSPLFTQLGIPGIAVLPIATKYIAGGTAMMGVTMDLMKEGVMDAVQLNRIAGITINPLDPVGIAVLAASGSRIGAVIRPAAKGALVGILFRGLIHFVVF